MTPATYTIEKGAKVLVRKAQTAILCPEHAEQLRTHAQSIESQRATRAARTREAKRQAREGQLSIFDGPKAA